MSTVADGATAVVILAGGLGTRMRSRLPKVLHPLAGRPIVDHVLAVAADISALPPVLVVSPATDQVAAHAAGRTVRALQAVPRGTADAVAAALPYVPPTAATVVVLSGDVPLVDAELVAALVRARIDAGAAVAFVSVRAADPARLGRVVRDADGRVARIVEAADATDAERALREVNAGIYAFDRAWLTDALPAIAPSPVTGELYLPLLVAAAVAAGRGAVAVDGPDDGTLAGINDRAELARAEALLRDRIVLRHQRAGVTIMDPATTWIDAEVAIAEDVTLEPDVRLRGATSIGRDARIGSGSEIADSRIGARTTILRSVVENAEVGDDVRVGPWAHLRAGASIGDGAEIGNYAEVKAARLGAGTKQHHFSYLGDAEIGAGVNIGAGTITANYDGRRKHRTVIGDRAFIGSDTVLRAPVRVGHDAVTGAGSVVTHDVPDGAVVAGVPARPRERRPESEGAG